MKDEIKKEITELLSDKKAREAIDIIKALNYDKSLDSLVMETIQEMVNEYDLYMTKHGRYMNFSDSDASLDMYKGFFDATKGEYGFVRVNNLAEDIFIPGDYKGNAMQDDLVLVKITKGALNTKNCEGKIVKVLKRSNKSKVGEVVIKNHRCFIRLHTLKNKDLIPLKGDTKRLVAGDLVTVKMMDDAYEALYLTRIGHKNDPGIDIECVLAEHDFETKFNDEVLKQLETIPTEVLESDLEGRHDLRDKEIFTIDGDDTKDIDDAISLERLSNGNYMLGVHIADVSYYVRENTPLDEEARKRGTSVYLADRVVPMLPHQLSNGICSLNPEVDRLALTCMMELDPKSNFVNYDIYPSVIRSRKQMTYNHVNEILEQGITPEGYEEFVPTLKLMQELASIVRKRKIRQGYIDFDVDEAKIVVDEEGNVLDIKRRYRGTGEKLIEDFMILANEAVATYISDCNLPGVYRVHGSVNEERLRKFLKVLEILGITVKDNLNNINQHTIQRIIKIIEEKRPEAFQVLSTYMLSCMAKAKYQTENIGHFALALRNYTHFTSPIRRYPDTTTHRLIHDYFFSKDGITEEKIRHYEQILDEICLTSSERERASIECEREVDKMKMAEYMENYIGSSFTGVISGLTSNGMFVLLDNLVEGMIRYDTFDERIEYDSEREIAVGSRTHRVFTLGTKIDVKVINASKITKQIDFEEKKVVLDEEREKEKVKKKY